MKSYYDNSDSTRYPTCPKCGDERRDWWDGLGFSNDGDESVVMCGKCETEYRSMIQVSTSFLSEAIES